MSTLSAEQQAAFLQDFRLAIADALIGTPRFYSDGHAIMFAPPRATPVGASLTSFGQVVDELNSTPDGIKRLAADTVHDQLQRTIKLDQPRAVRELLAILHGDGGHYTAEHGIEKSAIDALEKHTRRVHERLNRPPSGYAYRYAGPVGEGNYIRHNSGEEVNGEKSIGAVPFWYDEPPATAALPHLSARLIQKSDDDEADRGPWTVGDDGNLYSDDFNHDVKLGVNGDFTDETQRLSYAVKIADKLNSAPLPPQGAAVAGWHPAGCTLVDNFELATLRERAALPLRIGADELWHWQGDGQDFPESLSCPVVMTADSLRALLKAATPQPAAPAQVAGSEAWRDEVQAVAQMADAAARNAKYNDLANTMEDVAERLTKLIAAPASPPAALNEPFGNSGPLAGVVVPDWRELPVHPHVRARTLLTLLWRNLDNGGRSMGRSFEAVLLEAAMRLTEDQWDADDVKRADGARESDFINDTRDYVAALRRHEEGLAAQPAPLAGETPC